MFKRKMILVALALALVIGGIPGIFAQEAAAAGSQAVFKDMPGESHWSFSSLNAAVANGLLNGFELNDGTYIKPEAALTRAQMAAIVNRAFGAQAAASLTGITDVPSYAWYAGEMAKAIQMGTFMRDATMRPNDSITRQEAFVVLARAFKLKDSGTSYAPLNAFSDKAQVAAWAQAELSAMTAAGYVEGSGGMLHPKDTITRAEFAKVMDNMVKQYIDVAGTYTDVAEKGNVVIRVPGVTLDGVSIDGDLVIGDGVGDGDAILKNITVEGRAVIRGGGENSVKFIGSATDVKNIVITRGADGRVRILTQDGAVLAEAEVDGDSDVILEGEFESVTVLSENVTVTAQNATITDVAVQGANSNVILSGTTTVTTVAVSGTSSSVAVQSGATVETVKVTAPSVTVSGEGTVKTVEVQSGGTGAAVNTANTQLVVSEGVNNVTVGNTVVEGGTTVVTNDDGDDVTVVPPTGGGGSTTPAMAISIEEVAVSGTPVSPTGGVYIIPGAATKDNTSIDVAISNTRTGNYNVSLTIKNAANQTVAYAASTGLAKQYLDALDVFGGVTFTDIANMFDRLGDAPSGYYLNAAGIQVPGSTLSAFQDSIQASFDRMSNGEVYSVTVAFSGAASATLTFQVQKNII